MSATDTPVCCFAGFPVSAFCSPAPMKWFSRNSGWLSRQKYPSPLLMTDWNPVRREVNPVRNSTRYDSKPSGALNPAGPIIKPNPAAGQRGIISNGVKADAQFHEVLLHRDPGKSFGNAAVWDDPSQWLGSAAKRLQVRITKDLERREWGSYEKPFPELQYCNPDPRAPPHKFKESQVT